MYIKLLSVKDISYKTTKYKKDPLGTTGET